jgi:serine/threonine-protein kinase
VKPANVLFDEGGTPHLSDFGAAHVGDAAATVTAGLFGTLAYMSPEQREGRPATPASDLYAVGAVLFECLCGVVFREGAPLPSQAEPALDARHDAILQKLLAREASDRPASATDALALLDSVAWPDVETRANPRAPSVRPEARARFRRDATELVDTVLERAVRLVPLDDAVRAMGRAYCRADDEALAAVYAIDHDANALVVELTRGVPLDRALTVEESNDLARALTALHREGVAHGAVDCAHVVVDPSKRVVLAFPDPCADASPSGDLADLARLGDR